MFPRSVLYLLFLVFIQVGNILSSSEQPEVKLYDARIIGSYINSQFKDETKTSKMFLGIPYAEPPVGKYRFKKAELLMSLPTVVNATEFKPGCMQNSQDMPFDIIPEAQSEDCLYLNVFLPDAKPDKETGHAVMVFIHGGGFVFGSGMLQAESLSSYGNVIIVSINYRLGLFGFLSTGDEHGPGNQGLWDQHVALQWVHNNIAAFGGDNKRVTVFGESAGGVSVLHQALYPHNEGLFQRVIAESGAPSMKFLFQTDPLKIAKFYADSFGCENSDSEGIITCLQSKTAAELADKQSEEILSGKTIDVLGVVPHQDNDFVRLDVVNVDHEAEVNHPDVFKFYRSLDIINGVNSAEGLILYTPQYLPMMGDPKTFKPTRRYMDEMAIASTVKTHFGELDSSILKVVNAFYTDWSAPDCPERLREQLVKLGGDLMFVVPAVQYSRLHVNTTTTIVNSYVYYLSAKPTASILGNPSWSTGANHGDDLNFVFHFKVSYGKSIDAATAADWEIDLSLDVMRYWSNFAKSGNPNQPEKVKSEWPKYNMDKQSYLEFDKNLSDDDRKNYFYAEEAELWLNTIPSLRRALGPQVEGSSNVQGSCSADGECENP